MGGDFGLLQYDDVQRPFSCMYMTSAMHMEVL